MNSNKDIVDFLIKVEEISKVGLKFSKDPYARDNYQELQNLAKEFINDKMGVEMEKENFFQRDIYPTPNVSVRTICFSPNRKKILLVKEKLDGKWSIPGGWSELTLTPSQSALKELREEAGCEGKLIRLVGVFDRYRSKHLKGVPEYIVVFEGEITKVVSEPCFEIIETKWFDIDDLPEWSIKNNKEQMEKIISVALNGETSFD